MSEQSKEQIMRMEYEIMHASVEELSRSHNVNASVIRSFIEEEGWEQVQVRDDAERLDLINDQLSSLSTRNQALLTRRFLSLQEKVLMVADRLLDKVAELQDVAALKIVSEVIELHRPASLANNAKDNGSKGVGEGIRIQVISKFGDGPDAQVNAVQISETAGANNGIGALERMN